VSFERALDETELWEGEMRGLELRGVPVLLLRTGGEVRAFADRCAHQRVRLSEGHLEGEVLVCRAHGWRYDARTGCGLNPEGVTLERFQVRSQAGTLYVDVTGEGGARG
jgi:toluene monooxygenase system ferredoxin subunit